MFLLINAVNTANKSFQVLGDVTASLTTGSYIQVLKSTGNNGIYKLASSVYASGYTTLVVTTAIPSAVADGSIAGGVYELTFSDSTIAGKTSLVIAPWANNSTTSLKFSGKATLNYGSYQQQNILRVLENFAASVAPTNPTIGQHWYDAANDVVKVYTAAGWSSSVNVEGGSISFKDPQHPTANTKYYLTAAEPTGKTASGVTLYPAVNPTAGMALFRIVDANGVVYFEVDYSGKLVSANPLNVTATTDSTFVNSVTVNTGGGATNGLNVKNNVAITTGSVNVASGYGMLVTGAASVLLSTAVTLKGSSTSAGVIVQSSTGTTTTTFADALVTFAVAVNLPTLTVTGTANIATLGVTGVSTLATANITTLNVSGATTLASLTVTGSSTLAATSVTTLTATGASTLAAVSATSLTVSGASTLASATMSGTLTVTGTTTLNGAVNIPTAPTVGNSATNKTYVDGLAAAKVAKAGDSMTGNLDMGGVARVVNAMDPVNPQDYVTLNSLNNLTINGGTF